MEKIMGMKQRGKGNKRRIVAALLVCCFTGMMMGCVFLSEQNVQSDESDKKDNQEMREDRAAFFSEWKQNDTTGNSFFEEGTTVMGTISQQADFPLTAAFMYVEEVYVVAGDSVTEGDALFKITEDSIAEANSYYEKEIASAKDYLNEMQLAYEAGEMEASYTKQEALSNADGAADALERALQELEEDVENKYTKWQDAAYKISVYSDNLYNNIYYISAGVEEKTVALESAKTAAEVAQVEYVTAESAYAEAKTQFEAAMTTVNNFVSGELSETETLTIEIAAATMVSAYENMANAEELYNEKRTASEQAWQTKRQAEQELTQANSTWQKSEEQAKASLEQLEGSVDSLQLAYETANMEAETKRLNLQKEYESCVLEGETAESNYRETVAVLEKKVQNAQESLDSLLEEQETLSLLKEGIVTASQSGTLASVTYEAGDILKSETVLVTYYDTDIVTISVEVEQENIAKIAVGDVVQVAISGMRRGNVEGRITSIASAATTGRSVSDVTYAVVVTIDNTDKSLSAGQSASVTFEYDERG